MISFSWIMAYIILLSVLMIVVTGRKGLLRCFDNRRVDNIYVIYYEA